MKKSFIISGIMHLVIILGLFLIIPASPRLEGYPTVYRVGLVSFPAGGGKAGEGKGIQATVSASKQEEKGVAVKEFKKTTPKKKPKKAPEKKGELTSAQKKDGKITQKDEFGSQYGLGNGMSAATVDGGDFGSPYYLTLVFGKIRELWENPVETSSTLRVTIYFKIMKDGQIIDSKVEKSSGIDLFDQSAMRAILSGAPFPPLPVEYTGEYLGIHLEFEYIQ